MEVRLNGLGTQDNLKQHIITSGCYSPQENERIYHKWFARGPRYLFRAVDRKYHLTQGTLCDVGCAYGTNLVFGAPGSYGIELETYEVAFANSIGLTVHNLDVIHADFADLPRVDAVWNSATLEHVESPHIFLRKLHQLLKPGGLLGLYVPTIPPFRFLKHVPRLKPYFTGYLHGDHINAFTPSTIRFFCERAGFETIEVSAFYPGILAPLGRFPLTDGCVYVGRKIEGWEYSPSATRRTADNPRGFDFVGQKFGE
ncbi:MAG: class I SAM-dependent methyltransferase [Chloroflexi bacterium]|nr:class I SAM-dependent methyltransferase [Chloroflexota bacterium]